jgi:protease-4
LQGKKLNWLRFVFLMLNLGGTQLNLKGIFMPKITYNYDPIFIRLFKQALSFIWKTIVWGIGGVGRLVVVLILFSLIGSFLAPTLPHRSILTIDLGYGVSEHASAMNLLDDSAPYVGHILSAQIEAAATDDRVQGIVFYGDHMPIDLSTVQELLSALDTYHTSGKKSYFYARAIGGGIGSGWMEYYFASHCSEVVLTPVGQINFLGIAAEKPFVKELFDDLGVTPEFSSRHEYKTAADMYRRKKMSTSDRENTLSLIKNLYAQMPLPSTQIGIIFAQNALKNKLVNRLAYFDGFKSGLEHELDAEFVEIDLLGVDPEIGDRDIAVLILDGVIMPDSLDDDTGFITPSFVRHSLKDIQSRGSDALVVRVNSPGGDYIASDEIYHMLMALDMPIIISQGSVAASGGYFISIAGDTIVANPATITGSIGVVGGKFHLQKLMKKWGINVSRETVGPLAGFESAAFPMTSAQRKSFDQSLDVIYEDFTSKVSVARHMTPTQLDKLARGRVFTGKQAKANGLVDALGGLDTAIGFAKNALKLDKETSVSLTYYAPQDHGMGLIRSLLTTHLSIIQQFKLMTTTGQVQMPMTKILY